jgi:hypothetical protein
VKLTDFDIYFPFLKKLYQVPMNVSVLTSSWFADLDAADTLYYTCTMNDGSPSPSWMTFDKKTGWLEGTPSYNNPSEMIFLRISAFDNKHGVSSLFKQFLINSIPKAVSKYIVWDVNYGKMFSFSIRDLFVDQDGDYLKFSIPD